MSGTDEGFLQRWSRLKRQGDGGDGAREGGGAPESAAPQTDLPSDSPPDRPPDPLPELPPLETLTADSDYAPFLGTAVPAAIRKEAMRRLWSSDPLFGQVDALDIHTHDQTFPTVPAVVSTLWRAGRGLVEAADATEATGDGKSGLPESSIRYDQDSIATVDSPYCDSSAQVSPVNVESMSLARKDVRSW